jgi:ribosome small subunit-dependent GTPase A
MAKRKGKGKAGRRIKDWRERISAGENPDDIAQRGRKPGTRAVKLPPSRLAAPEENLENLPKKEGLVIGVYRRAVSVLIEGRTCYCAVAKTFRAPPNASALAVGDMVTVAVSADLAAQRGPDDDKEQMDGFVLARRLRQTALSRPKPTSTKRLDQYQPEIFEQVIAANMDQILIIASMVQPKFRRRLIDRYLIVAQRGLLAPLLVINKVDLRRPGEDLLDDMRLLGLEVLCCSAQTGEGLDEFRLRLAGKRSVLAGASGVGKSTLVNSLIPQADAVTRTVRPKDLRGRHTTVAATVYYLPDPATMGLAVPPPAPAVLHGWAAEKAAELEKAAPDEQTPEGHQQQTPSEESQVAQSADRNYQAPLPFEIPPGGMIVDTPGVRELGFTIDAAKLPWYFPEFEPFVHQCHFSNCTHTHEPNCAVIAAVQRGEVPARRFESYVMIRQSLRDRLG